ncbi:MAG: hypothetical protein ACLR7Y_14925 [Dysosmobacter sp.]
MTWFTEPGVHGHLLKDTIVVRNAEKVIKAAPATGRAERPPLWISTSPDYFLYPRLGTAYGFGAGAVRGTADFIDSNKETQGVKVADLSEFGAVRTRSNCWTPTC